MWQKKSDRKAAKLANRGKEPEDDVKAWLVGKWAAASPHREANRLEDSRSVRRIIRARPADFEFYTGWDPASAFFGLIEVKSTKHDYRLTRDNAPQLPAMRKRELCGGICFFLVYHSTLQKWRLLHTSWMVNSGDRGSWNIGHLPLWDTPEQAAHAAYPEIF